MDKKTIKKILVVSGFVSLISGIGYILEKLSYLADTFPFQQILIFSLVILSVFFVILILVLKYKFNLEDQKIIYFIKILNEQGDAFIKREGTFKVNEGDVKKREHTAFSDGSKMEKKDLELKAWDNSGHTLYCKFVLDKPATKKFEIYFPYSISKNKNYTYTYQFLWNRLFVKENDYYMLQDTSINPEFHLVLPNIWKLQCVEATEIFRDGTNKDLKIQPKGQEIEDDNYIKYKYAIKKRAERHTQVRVEWHVK